MNTIDTRLEVNEALRRAFALSRRGRDLLLFSLLCEDEGEADDARGAAERWRELTGLAWNATRWSKAAVEMAEAGFAVPVFVRALLTPEARKKSNQFVFNKRALICAAARLTYNDTTGVTSRARDVLGKRPCTLERLAGRQVDGEAHSLREYRGSRRLRALRSLRFARALRHSTVDLKKIRKKQKILGAQTGAETRRASASGETRASVASPGIETNLPGQLKEQRESLAEVQSKATTGRNAKGITACRSASEPLAEVQAKDEPLAEVQAPKGTGGKKKSKRPRDPLLTIARDGKAVDVAQVAQLVDDAFFDRLPPPTESDDDEPPEVEPEAGQQVLPEFAAAVGEEATAPSKDATKLATKLVVFWGARSGRPRVRVTPDRLRMVRARLQEGYNQDDLHRAIAGVCYSPFHKENGHDTIEVAIRRAEQVEKGIRLWSLHAPIKFIAGYEQRTGIKVPERAEELATYYRREASKARAAEREKKAEQREKEKEGEGRTDEERRPKDAEELFARAFARRLQKEEEERTVRKIESLRKQIEFLGEDGDEESLEVLKAQLEELTKKQEQEEKKDND